MPWKSLASDRLTGLHLLLASFFALLGILVCREAWAEIFVDYAARDEEYQHIFLVPFVAILLIWVRRMRFRHCKPSGTILGPMIVALGWWMGWYGFNNQNTSMYHAGAVIVFVGCVATILGKNVLFRFMPAVLVLALLVPVPGRLRQRIAVPLNTWTAEMSQSVLDVAGVETQLSGNVVTINGRPVEVREACNGMRMVFPLLLIGYGFSFALPLRRVVRIVILLFSPIVAIACNVARTVPTVWLAGNARRISPLHGDQIFNILHEYGGWIMLPIAFLLLLSLVKILKWAMLPITRYTLAAQ